jgi:hypothetical protein
LPVVTFDNHEQQYRLNLADRVPCPLTDTEALWAHDEPHVLSAEAKERVTNRLLGRENPGWIDKGYIWDGQLAPVAEWPATAAQLGLDPNKPTALLCSNLAWDTAVLGRARTFSSMRAWIIANIAWFAQRPDWQLVVRAHPCEATMPTNEPCVGLIEKYYPKLPPNVALVKPADKINTYGIMRAAQMGLVYSTTVGFEMAARGLPTVVAADVHYGEKGFTYHATNAAEYDALLTKIAADPLGHRLTPRQVELALCYADMHFERFPKPFPWWHVDNPAGFGHETAMSDVLSGNCDPRYAATLDMLAGLRPVL